MLQQFTEWFLTVVAGFFSDLWNFVKDGAIHVFDLLTQAVVAALALIPVPAFVTGGMQSVFASVDPGILWLLSQSGLFLGFAILGSGVAFRLLRKVVTLGQW